MATATMTVPAATAMLRLVTGFETAYAVAATALRPKATGMISQMTLVPAGAELSLTLGSSSLAQDPGDLLYLQLPMPDAARLTISGRVSLLASTVEPGY